MIECYSCRQSCEMGLVPPRTPGRADAQVPYQAVARVMARLSTNGFAKLNLITATAGNTAEAEPVEGDL